MRDTLRERGAGHQKDHRGRGRSPKDHRGSKSQGREGGGWRAKKLAKLEGLNNDQLSMGGSKGDIFIDQD